LNRAGYHHSIKGACSERSANNVSEAPTQLSRAPEDPLRLLELGAVDIHTNDECARRLSHFVRQPPVTTAELEQPERFPAASEVRHQPLARCGSRLPLSVQWVIRWHSRQTFHNFVRVHAALFLTHLQVKVCRTVWTFHVLEDL
jgi:hypothetical protein